MLDAIGIRTRTSQCRRANCRSSSISQSVNRIRRTEDQTFRVDPVALTVRTRGLTIASHRKLDVREKRIIGPPRINCGNAIDIDVPWAGRSQTVDLPLPTPRSTQCRSRGPSYAGHRRFVVTSTIDRRGDVDAADRDQSGRGRRAPPPCHRHDDAAPIGVSPAMAVLTRANWRSPADSTRAVEARANFDRHELGTRPRRRARISWATRPSPLPRPAGIPQILHRRGRFLHVRQRGGDEQDSVASRGVTIDLMALNERFTARSTISGTLAGMAASVTEGTCRHYRARSCRTLGDAVDSDLGVADHRVRVTCLANVSVVRSLGGGLPTAASALPRLVRTRDLVRAIGCPMTPSRRRRSRWLAFEQCGRRFDRGGDRLIAALR